MSISDDQPINVGNLKAVMQHVKNEVGGGISLR